MADMPQSTFMSSKCSIAGGLNLDASSPTAIGHRVFLENRHATNGSIRALGMGSAVERADGDKVNVDKIMMMVDNDDG